MGLNNIFIGCGNKYTTAYYTVEKWLNEAMNNTSDFTWKNCSAPNDSGFNHPDDNAGKLQIMNEIKEQIAYSSIVIVISDMYYDNKKFMDFEIAAAKHYGKYIIGLRSWRNLKPVPKKILKNADEIVNLSSPELINAINMFNKINNPVSGK